MAIVGTPFEGAIWWHYLELGPLGGQNMIHGFDLVGTGDVEVSFGYNQKNLAHATPAYLMDSDSLTGQPIMAPVNAPSIQLRLRFLPNQAWQWNAATIYLDPVLGGA
jgi:hypothetical protein